MLNLKQDGTRATIDIQGVIGSPFEGDTSADKFTERFRAITPDSDIDVNILGSPGGLVGDGLVIYDLLASHPGNVTTNVSGLTGSMATVIAQAGKVRKMSKNSLYLIHRIQTGEMGTPTDLRNEADNAEVVENRLVQIYAKRTGRRESTIRRLMAANKERGDWWDAETALDLGFVDEISPDSKRAAFTQSEMRHMNLAVTPEMIDKGLVKQENMELIDAIKAGFSDLKNSIADFFKKDATDTQKTDLTAKVTAFETQLGELSTANASLTDQLATQKVEHTALIAAKDEEILKLKATATKDEKTEDANPDGAKKVHSPFDSIVDKIKNQAKTS